MSDEAPDLDAICRNAFGNPINEALDAAETVAGPLDGLVEKVKDDPGAAFAPEILEALLTLKASDRAAYENLRSKLKRAGCRVTALDDAMREESGEDGRGPTQADILIDLAAAAALFHTSDGTAYADIEVNGHRETWPVRNKGFKRWLARQFFERTDGAPNSEALQSALNVIEAKAHFDGTQEQIFVRVGGLDGRIYLDLADPEWRAIEIDGEGWRVVDTPPVRFRRSAGVKALPVPERGGTMDALRPFLNVGTEEDFVLAVAWMLATLRDRGPYPALVLAGEQGSAKSTFLAIMRELLDPNAAPLRALPREDRDLFIAATNGHLLAFDNVSGLAPWISDTLCRLATGGGFTTRQLYTDGDEVIFDAMRPVALNGIEDVVTRADLADRAVFLMLDAIPEDKRRPEAELWAEFHAARPRILGALLDAVAEGLKNLPKTKLPKLPRMADFALWASACETAAWEAGTFWDSYAENVDSAVGSVIEADPVANAVRELMFTRTGWTGTATALLAALTDLVGERTARAKGWPTSGRQLGGRLRRAATFLRKAGFTVDLDERGPPPKRDRLITIAYATPSSSEQTEGGQQPSTSSIPSTPYGKPTGGNGLVGGSGWTVNRGGGRFVRPQRPDRPATVERQPIENKRCGRYGRYGRQRRYPFWPRKIKAYPERQDMNAAEALKVARAAGVEVTAEGDDLVWTACDDPPKRVLAALAEHKAKLLALLRHAPDDPGDDGLEWHGKVEEPIAGDQLEDFGDETEHDARPTIHYWREGDNLRGPGRSAPVPAGMALLDAADWLDARGLGRVVIIEELPRPTTKAGPRGRMVAMPHDAPRRLRELARRISRLGLAGRWDPEAAFAEREALAVEARTLARGLEVARPVEYRAADPTTVNERCRRLEALAAAKSAEARKLRRLLASARPKPRQRWHPLPGQFTLDLEV